MAGAIGKGDWIECVDISPCSLRGVPDLTLGAIYLVECVYDAPVAGGAVVRLVGKRHPRSIDGAYGINRFRPIYRPRASFIESLKQPAPARKAPPQPAPREREGV